MSAPIHPSMSGVILAITFTAAIIGARLWLLRDRQAAPQPEPRTPRPAEAPHVILVPITDSLSAAHAVAMACLLAQDRGAEIVLAYILEVPLSLPLDAEVEEVETAAALALAVAREIVLQHRLPVRTVVRRARMAKDGIAAAARDREADLVFTDPGSRVGRGHPP